MAKKKTGSTAPTKINDGKTYNKNPRTITEGQFDLLKQTLEEFGDLSGVVHDLRTNEFVGGNQRSKVFSIEEAEIELTATYNPPTATGTVSEGFIIYKGERFTYRAVYWDDERIERANLIANKGGGSWDWDMLANAFDVDVLLSSGFTPQEISFHTPEPLTMETLGIGAGVGPGLDETEPDYVDTPTEEAITRVGDLYELAGGADVVHRILCADNRIADAVEHLLNGAVPVLMVTDPPYGVRYDPAWRNEALEEHNEKIGEIENDHIETWKETYALFPGDVVYLWHADKQARTARTELEEAGFEMINEIVWVKQHFAISRGNYHYRHEPCLYAVRKGKRHNWQGGRDQSTVWEINNNLSNGGGAGDDEKAINAAQKPIGCFLRPIVNNSVAGNAVYDPFLGSGTALIAAEKVGRSLYALDINPFEIDRVIRRFLHYCNDKSIKYSLLRNGQPLTVQDISKFYPQPLPAEPAS